MHLEFRKALIPEEVRSLVIFDRKVFADYPQDCFPREFWLCVEAWWMLVDNRKVGCCAFQAHSDFLEDIREDGTNPRAKGSLYIVTTGILPAFQGLGLGRILKAWQIAYAQVHGFKRIVTNTRKSNKRMLALNRQFGFRTVRTTQRYYSDPTEATVVMERLIT